MPASVVPVRSHIVFETERADKFNGVTVATRYGNIFFGRKECIRCFCLGECYRIWQSVHLDSGQIIYVVDVLTAVIRPKDKAVCLILSQ